MHATSTMRRQLRLSGVLALLVAMVVVGNPSPAHARELPFTTTKLPAAAKGIPRGPQGAVIAGAFAAAFETTVWLLDPYFADEPFINYYVPSSVAGYGWKVGTDEYGNCYPGPPATGPAPLHDIATGTQACPPGSRQPTFAHTGGSTQRGARWRMDCLDTATGARTAFDQSSDWFEVGASWDWSGSVYYCGTATGTGATKILERMRIWLGPHPYNQTTATLAYDLRYTPPGSVSTFVRQNCRAADGTLTTWDTAPVTGTEQHTVTPCPMLQPGSVRDDIGLWATPSTGDGLAEELAGTATWDPAAQTQYPLCATSVNGQPPCTLTPMVGSDSCFADGVECGLWTSRPDRSCKWGTYTVPNSWCTDAYGSWLAQPTTLEPTPTTAPTTTPTTGPTPTPTPVPGTLGQATTTHNPDGSTTTTQTQYGPDGKPTQTVTTTTRPDGAMTVTTQPLNPNGTPNGAPSTVLVPATGSGTTPEADREGCLSAAFGWNPVSWVYAPVKCALQWAFVPPAGYLGTQASQLRGSWEATPPGQLGTVVGGTVTALGGLDKQSSCAGPSIPWQVLNVGDGEAGDWHPFSACPEPVKTIASWVRLLSLIGIWGGALLVGFGNVAAAFGISTPYDGSELEA